MSAKKPTIEQLAQLYKVGRSTVENWKRQGADVYSAPELVAFVLKQRTVPKTWKGLQDGAGPIEEQIKIEQLRKLRLENEKLDKIIAAYEHRFLLKESVERRNALTGFAIGELVKDVRTQSGPMLEGLTAAEIDEKVEPWMDGWEERLKGDRDSIWREAPEDLLKEELRGDLKKARATKEKR